MGWGERVVSMEQRQRERKGREDAAFASLRELPAAEQVKVLAKIPDRKERCKVMLAIGMIDHIED